MAEPCEAGSQRHIVVGRPLTAEIGQEQRGRGRRGGLHLGRKLMGGLARNLAPPFHASSGGEDHAHLAPGAGMEWHMAWTALSGLGEYFALETKSTPEVPSDTEAMPSFTTPDPASSGGIVAPSPGHHRAHAHVPALAQLVAQLAGRFRAFMQLRHMAAVKAGERQMLVRPVALSDVEPRVEPASALSQAYSPVSIRRT